MCTSLLLCYIVDGYSQFSLSYVPRDIIYTPYPRLHDTGSLISNADTHLLTYYSQLLVAYAGEIGPWSENEARSDCQ
jgi:hypothetical protein